MAKKDKNKQADNSVVTPTFRVGYVELPDGEENDRYQITAIFDSDADISDLEDMVLDALKEAHGVKKFKEGYNNPLHDGNKRYKKSKRKEFKDATYCSLKTGFLPSCIDESSKKSKNAKVDDSSYLYAGAYFQAIVDVYSYNGKKGSDAGIGIGLQSLLKVKDGKKLSGGGLSPEQAREKFNQAGRGDEPKPKKKDKDKGKKKKK